eukprot:COSAG06_NODE_343_length_17092_cov_17.908021_5_plen_2916_part_00
MQPVSEGTPPVQAKKTGPARELTTPGAEFAPKPQPEPEPVDSNPDSLTPAQLARKRAQESVAAATRMAVAKKAAASGGGAAAARVAETTTAGAQAPPPQPPSKPQPQPEHKKSHPSKSGSESKSLFGVCCGSKPSGKKDGRGGTVGGHDRKPSGQAPESAGEVERASALPEPQAPEPVSSELVTTSMEAARENASGIELAPKDVKECVLTIAGDAESFADHDSRAKIWQAIKTIQSQQLLESSADSDVSELGMMNAQNLAYHMLIAAAKMTADPKSFIAGMECMGCATNAIMIVYASRAKYTTPKHADMATSTDKFEKTNHMPLIDVQKTLMQIMKGLRKSLKQSPRLKAAKLPLNRVNLYLSIMELGVDSLKDIGAQRQAAKEGGKFIFGVAKSIVTMKVDSSVLEVGKNLASAGMREKRRMNAERVFKTVAYIDRWRRDLILLLKATLSTTSDTDSDAGAVGISAQLREAKLILCHLQHVATWEPRFEVPTAFVDLLGDLLQIEGLSTLADGDFAAWLWAGDAMNNLEHADALVVGTLEPADEFSRVSVGSRRMLNGQPCEILELKTAAAASFDVQHAITRDTLVKIQCMDGTVSNHVRLGDTSTLEEFNGLSSWMAFGEPPSLQYRKENTASGNLSSEKLHNLKSWATELSSSVLTGNQTLKEWLEEGVTLLKTEFSSAAESVEKRLHEVVANASGEVTKLLMSRMSRRLETVDPADLKQTEIALLSTITSATAAADLASSTATKLQTMEALCSPVLHAIVQAHTMIAKIAKCADPFTMLLAKLVDMVERVGARVKEALSDIIESTQQQITGLIEQKLGAAAQAAVDATASALDELYANSAASSQAKQVDVLFNRLEAAFTPNKDVTSKRSLGMVAMESLCHGLTAQLKSLDGFINLIEAALTGQADTSILQIFKSVCQSFTTALTLFNAVRDQIASFMAPVVSAMKEWARYAHARLLKGGTGLEADHKGNMLAALKVVVESGQTEIKKPIKKVSNFIKDKGLDVVDELATAINAVMISRRNAAKGGVRGQAYEKVHAVIVTVSDSLAKVIGVLEGLLQQCGTIQRTIDASVRPSVQAFVKNAQAAHQMVQAGFVGTEMLTADQVEGMLRKLIRQCQLANDSSSSVPGTAGFTLADEVYVLGGMLDGLGAAALDALSAASSQFNIEIELDLPDLSALKDELKDIAADMMAAAEDFVEDAEEKISEVAADAAELLDLDTDGDDDDDDGMEEESGAFSSALVKDGFNLMKSFWSDKNARKETWRVRECAAYQALLLMASLSPQSTSEDGPMEQTDGVDTEDTNAVTTAQQILEVAERNVASAAAAVTEAEKGQLAEVQLASQAKAKEHAGIAELVASIQQAITQRKAMEAVPAAKRILSQPEFVESIHMAMKTQWKTQEEEVHQQIDTMMKELDQLREDIAKTDNPDEKAKLLVLCKQERKRLQSVLRGVGSVGVAIGVVIGFLSEMTETLDEINGKLDVIAKDLQEMRADIKDVKDDLQRLTGLSIVEKVGLMFESIIRRGQRPADEVHIDIDGLTAGPDKDFKQSDKNPPFPLVAKLVEVLTGPTEQEGKNIGTVLVAGQSGSGKSLVVLEMESLLAEKFSAAQSAAMGLTEKNAAAETTNDFEPGATMSMDVVVRIALPELSEPLTEMVEETLARKWQCTAAQITELRQKVEEGQIQLIFILDGYDELRPQLLGKNLYKTNNLEKWRSKQQQDEKDYCRPKVVIFTRTELLTGWKGYQSAFVPLESDNEDKDEVEEAIQYLTEYRIAPFTKFGTNDSKVDQYIAAHVAVETQVLLGHYFGVKKTLAAEYLLTVAAALHNVRQCMTSDADAVPDGKGSSHAITAVGTAVEILRRCHASSVDADAEARFGSTGLQSFVKDELSDQFWTPVMFSDKFEEMEELQELTRTAFMMKILSNILPRLVAASSSPTATKRELILLLDDEDQADVLMAVLRKERMSTREELLDICACKSHDDAAASDKLHEVAHAAAERWTNAATVERTAKPCSNTEVLYAGALKRAFQRRPLTRFAIFAEFVTFWVAREADKMLAGTSMLTAAEMARDAPLLAEALAVQMTMHNRPKVTYEQTSQIAAIKKPSVWDQFFEEDRSEAGQALMQVRRAAPITQNGNVYSMVHKSVQEYLVGNCLMNEMARCVDSSRIEPKTDATLRAFYLGTDVKESSEETEVSQDGPIGPWIEAIARHLPSLQSESEHEQDAWKKRLESECRSFVNACRENGFQTPAHLANSGVSKSDLEKLGLVTMRLRLLVMRDINRRQDNAPPPDGTQGNDAVRRVLGFSHGSLPSADAQVDAVASLVHILETSLWNKIMLLGEQAVVDFVADQLLSDLSLVKHFDIVALLSIYAEEIHTGRLQRVAENVRALCLLPLARRGGQCLGHLAAATGNTALLQVWLCVAKHPATRQWVDTRVLGVTCATAAAKMAASELESRVLRHMCPTMYRERFGYGGWLLPNDFLRTPLPALTAEEAAFAESTATKLELAKAWAKVPENKRVRQAEAAARRAMALTFNTDDAKHMNIYMHTHGSAAITAEAGVPFAPPSGDQTRYIAGHIAWEKPAEDGVVAALARRILPQAHTVSKGAVTNAPIVEGKSWAEFGGRFGKVLCGPTTPETALFRSSSAEDPPAPRNYFDPPAPRSLQRWDEYDDNHDEDDDNDHDDRGRGEQGTARDHERGHPRTHNSTSGNRGSGGYTSSIDHERAISPSPHLGQHARARAATSPRPYSGGAGARELPKGWNAAQQERQKNRPIPTSAAVNKVMLLFLRPSQKLVQPLWSLSTSWTYGGRPLLYRDFCPKMGLLEMDSEATMASGSVNTFESAAALLAPRPQSTRVTVQTLPRTAQRAINPSIFESMPSHSPPPSTLQLAPVNPHPDRSSSKPRPCRKAAAGISARTLDLEIIQAA